MISTCQFCLKTFPHCLAFERHKHLYKNGECVNDPDSLPSRNVPARVRDPPRGTPFLDEDPVQPSDSHPDDEVASEEDTSCNQEEIDQLVWSTLSSMKISIRDQQTILDLMNDLRGYKDKTGLSCSITTIEGFNQYTSKTVSSMKSLLIHPSKEGKVTVTSADVPGLGDAVFEAPYFYEDMDHFLRMEFGNEDHKGQFVLHASIKTDVEGNRCYDDPHSADLWNWFQRRIRSNVGYERSVVASLQLYSDKTHLNFKGTDCHPVLATLLNICHGKRIKSYKHVAYLPKMSQTTLDVSASVFRFVKLSAYSKIITALLATMKEKSHTGVTLTDPWGKEQNVFVRFCSYVVDNPEIADMWCTKQGQTAFPCEVRKGAQRQASKMLLKELVPTSRSTSYVMASKSGSHQLGNTKRPLKVSFDVLKGNMSSSTSSEDVQMLLKNQPELKSHNLCGKLEALLLIEKCDVAACINVSNSCTFCSVPSWGEGHNDFYELQTVRASANVYNKPWFDSITVMGQENDNEVTWYAEIRLLFFCVSRVHSKKIPFMFVRWYEIVRTRDILSAFGCTRLKGTDHYDVLPLASALGRVYVVQDFKVPGQYHVSSFKWDRSPVALAADKVDAYGNNVK
eukprot:gene25678-biopygen20166